MNVKVIFIVPSFWKRTLRWLFNGS